MSRYIDADALKEKIERTYINGIKLSSVNAVIVKIVNDLISDAPTIELPTWIPCSERLPTEEEQDIDLGVLVTLGNGYKGMDFDWYHDGRWYDWNRCVIAWMPLPKPYEESEK